MLAVASVALMPRRAAALAADEKLSIQEVERRLKRNFEVDQYYVSGNVDASIFADDCVFTDPTIKSVGAFHGQQSAHMHALSASHTTACAQVLDLCRLSHGWSWSCIAQDGSSPIMLWIVVQAETATERR